MSGSSRKLMGTTAAGGAELLAIEDCFSCFLYTGNDSTQTITNGIDLAGEGGLVWIKGRSATKNNALYDTERGVNQYLYSNSTLASTSGTNMVTAFNSDGFSIGSNALVNEGPVTYASWTWRKAPRWFDVVTYTGDGTGIRMIDHSLGLIPGAIVVKRTDSTSNWLFSHRGFNSGIGQGYLNLTNAFTTSAASDVQQGNSTDTQFYVRDGANTSGATYVAYLFAHDPLGPSGDGSDGLIACGSYTGTGGAGLEVNLGWEPQWLVVKEATDVGDWRMFDNMRGWVVGGDDAILKPNSSGREADFAFNAACPTPTGFKLEIANADINASGQTYIYIAIRRGPMRQPTSGTDVFDVALGTGTYTHTTGFPVDLAIQATRATTIIHRPYDRLRGGGFYLETSSTGSDQGGGTASFDNNTGYTNFASTLSAVDWMLRRAPGFFDVVAYTGDGVAGRTVSHNLGVAPELMIIKRRDTAASWIVFAPDAIGNTQALILNSTSAKVTYDGINNTDPTDAVFTLGNDSDVNGSGGTYIAYLFATLPGVSKVGSYTGDGTTDHSNVINCGFTTGARFVLIKRSDGSGDWNVYDTARGMAASTIDPELILNDTGAENSDYDLINTTSSGFSVSNIGGGINLSGVNYIFLAIA